MSLNKAKPIVINPPKLTVLLEIWRSNIIGEKNKENSALSSIVVLGLKTYNERKKGFNYTSHNETSNFITPSTHMSSPLFSIVRAPTHTCWHRSQIINTEHHVLYLNLYKGISFAFLLQDLYFSIKSFKQED